MTINKYFQTFAGETQEELDKTIKDSIVFDCQGSNPWITVTVNMNPEDARPIDIRRFL